MYTKPIFLVALIVCGSAVEAPLHAQLSDYIDDMWNVTVKENEFGNHFVTLLEMKVRQSSFPQQIFPFLNGVLKAFQAEKSLLQNEYSRESERLSSSLRTVEAIHESQVSELKSTNNNIENLTQELAQLASTYSQLTEQLELLNGKEQALRDNRAKDETAYNVGQIFLCSIGKNKMHILGVLTDKLAQMVFEDQDNLKASSFIETDQKTLMDQIIIELGHGNPLLNVLQVTSTFSQKVVIDIIQKLEQMRTSVEEQVEEADALEIQEKRNFDTVIQQIIDVRKGLTSDKLLTSQTIRRKDNERNIARSILEELTRDIPLTTNNVQSTRNELEILTAKYQENLRDLNQKIDVAQYSFDNLEKLAAIMKSKQN